MSSPQIAVLTREQLDELLDAAVARGAALVAPRPAEEENRLKANVSIADAAEYLGVSLRTVSRMLSDGRLTPVRSGGIVRIRRAQLLAFGGGA